MYNFCTEPKKQHRNKDENERKKQKAGDIKKILNKMKTGKLDGWY